MFYVIRISLVIYCSLWDFDELSDSREEFRPKPQCELQEFESDSVIYVVC